jgi:hypothetical protein
LAFSYWFYKPQFLTELKLAVVLIIPSLGVPNWLVIYINTAPQSNFPKSSVIKRTQKESDREAITNSGRNLSKQNI